jgi:ABC-type nitrate/sulfonate/bicarbonate transport system substrate-binding protein
MHWGKLLGAAIGAVLLAQSAQAADSVIIGAVGRGTATNWPTYIAVSKGYFDAAGIKPDFVYTQSSSALVQQLTAGSVEVALSVGLVDPLRAIDKGAAVALIGLEMQSPPYAILAKPTIKKLEDLKGKTISLGGSKDITRIFAERMLGPHGVKPGDYDMVFAGSTAARFAALKSGAVDATILLPPFNFFAESAGFTNLGLTVDYAKDLPFSGSLVNRAWAAKNEALLRRLISVGEKSMAWFIDPKNRDEAISIMVASSKLKSEDVAKAYDFLMQHKFFENAGTVSKAKLTALTSALKELGDIQGSTDTDRFILKSVAKVID